MNLYPSNYRWIILIMSYICMISFALVFQSIPAVMILIISELKITFAEAGLFMSLFALPGIIIAIPAGIISDRFGMRRIGIVSLILMAIGSFVVGVSSNFFLLVLGRFISGIGSFVLAILFPQLISRWFLKRDIGLGMGIFNTAMPLGTIISFNLLSFIGENFGWRAPVFITTLVAIIALLIFLWLFKEPISHSSVKKFKLSIFFEVGLPIWLVGLIWMLFNASIISFLTFAKDFLINKGFGNSYANFLSSLVMVGSLFVSPIIGYLINKSAREEIILIISGVGLAIFFILITIISPIFVLIVIAILNAFVPPPIFSIPSKIIQPQFLGLAFGILTTCLNIGILIGPYLIGFLRDFTGDYSFSFYLMSIFSIIQVFVTILLYFKKK